MHWQRWWCRRWHHCAYLCCNIRRLFYRSTLRSKKGKLFHDSKDGSQPGRGADRSRQTGRGVPKVKTGTKQAVEDQASSSSVTSGILCQKKQQQSAELQKKKSLTGNVRKRTANTRCTTDVKKKRKTDWDIRPTRSQRNQPTTVDAEQNSFCDILSFLVLWFNQWKWKL